MESVLSSELLDREGYKLWLIMSISPGSFRQSQNTVMETGKTGIT